MFSISVGTIWWSRLHILCDFSNFALTCNLMVLQIDFKFKARVPKYTTRTQKLHLCEDKIAEIKQKDTIVAFPNVTLEL